VECTVVGFAGSAYLNTVHNLPLSGFLLLSFSLSFLIDTYRNFGSNRCNSLILNITLMFLSHEPCALMSPLLLLRIQSIPKP